jgi:uncharacterized protein YbaR (Trm112 family)
MSETPSLQTLDEDTLSILRCPVTGSALRLEDGFLVSQVGQLRYTVRDNIPVLLAEEAKLPPGFETLDAFKAHFKDQIKR